MTSCPRRLVAAAVALVAALLALPSAAQGVLEKVEGEQGRAWLFGSLHFGSDDLYPLGERVERAFTASDRIMVEVNLLDLDASAVQELVREKGTYPDGGQLRRHVPEGLWQRLVGAAAGLGLPARTLESQRPWLAALSVTTAFLARQGLTPAQGVDQHFMRRARRAGLPILELERFSDQLDLLFGTSRDDQVAMLEDTLTQVEENRSLPSELLAAWRVGDRGALEKLLIDGLGKGEAGRRLTRRLLDARNGPMAERIAEEVRRGGTVFVVVGAAHLLGSGRLQSHLERLGLEVSR